MKVNTILLVIIISLSSCSVINKAFHKSKTVVDSTSHVITKKDSTVLKDSVAVHGSQKENTEEIIINWGRPKEPADSLVYSNPSGGDWDSSFLGVFVLGANGEIRSSRVPVSVTIKRSGSSFNYDSLADHSKITVSGLTDNDTHLQKKEKDVVKEVHKKRFFTWQYILLIVILCIISYYLCSKNREKIRGFLSRVKSIIIHFFTGL